MRYTLLLLLSLLSVAVLAQDKIITHHDEVINGFVVEISESSVFYSTDSVNENLKRIAKEDILMILKADGTVINLSETTPATPVAEVTEQPDRFPIVDLSQYHGYLLQKGNCVYIPTDSPYDYERAGQEEFKEKIKKDGCWQVVDKLEQAHFVLIFHTSLEGRDSSYGIFRQRAEYEKQKTVIGNIWYISFIDSDLYVWDPRRNPSDETIATNKAMAITIVETIRTQGWYDDVKRLFNVYGKVKRTKAWIIP